MSGVDDPLKIGRAAFAVALKLLKASGETPSEDALRAIGKDVIEAVRFADACEAVSKASGKPFSEHWISEAEAGAILRFLTPPEGSVFPSWDYESFCKVVKMYLPVERRDELAVMTHCALWIMHLGYTSKDALILCIWAQSYTLKEEDKRCKNPPNPPPGYKGDLDSYHRLSDKEKRLEWRPVWVAKGQYKIGLLSVWGNPFRPVKSE